jgi:hypothetical protein
MKDKVTIFIFTSPDVDELLMNYETDLVELLRRRGVDVERISVPDPAQLEELGEKSASKLVIGVSAAALLSMSLAPLVTEVIQDLSPDVTVRERICEPVFDVNDNVVRDNAGQPVYRWIDREEYSRNTSIPNNSNEQVTLKTPIGLSITTKKTAENQAPNK